MDLFKKHMQAIGINTFDETRGLEEFVTKSTKVDKNNYLFYFLSNEDLLKIRHQLQSHNNILLQNVILLVEDELKETGGEDNVNIIKTTINTENDYYIWFFEVLRVLLPTIDIDGSLAEFKNTVNNLGNYGNNVEHRVSNDKGNEVQSLIKQYKRWIIMLSGTVTLILLFSLSLIFFDRTAGATIKSAPEKPVIADLNTQQERPCDTNKNIKSLNYLPFELVKYFVGRTEEIKQIDEMLKQHRIAILNAFAGTGKTTLAAKYGHDRKNSGIIVRWINADSSDKVITGYLQIARELGITDYADTSDSNQKLALIRRVLAEIQTSRVPVLLIFDNVEKYDSIKDTLLNMSPNVEILITTRSQKLDDSLENYNIRIEPFTRIEAQQYFKKALHDKGISNQDIDNLVDKYNTAGGLLPLKLSQAVSIINTSNRLTIKEYIDNMEKYDDGVNVLISGIDKHTDSWKILQYTAYLDPDFMPFEIFDRLLGRKLPEEDIEYLKSQLLTEVTYYDNNNGFRVHRLVQDSLKNYIQQNPEDALSHKKITDKLLISLDSLFPEVTKTPDKDWQKAEMLLPHVLKVIKNYDNVADKHTVSLYNKLGAYNLNIMNQLNQALDYFTKALRINETAFKDDGSAIAYSLNNMGVVYNILGQSKTALDYHKKALAIRQQIYTTPDINVAHSLNNIGLVYYDLGGMKEALEYHKQALEIYKNLYGSNHADIANSYNKIGRLYRDLGDYDEALKYATMALEAYQELYYRIFSALGDHQKALDYTFKALQINQKIYKSPHPDNVLFLTNIGWTMNDLKDPKQAIKYCQQALDVKEKLYNNDHSWAAYALKCLADSYYLLSDYNKSLEYSMEALEMDRKSCDEKHPYIARAYHNVAKSQYKLENYPTALEYYQRSINIKQPLFGYDNHLDTAESLHGMAEVYNGLKDKAKSLELLGRTYIIYKNILGSDNQKTKEVEEIIIENSPDFLKNIDSRDFIKIEVYQGDETTVKIKEKIQKKVLNKIQLLSGQGEWSKITSWFGDKGVKGYLDESSLGNILGDLSGPENIEKARMLCFEAINLGIIQSKNKNYTCLEEYAKTFPQLINKIKQTHREYFVDSSIASRF